MRVLPFLLILFMVVSCNDGDDKPDVSDIKMDLTLTRFEKDFFAIDTNNLGQGLNELKRKHPGFYPFFINKVLLLDIDPNAPLNLLPQDQLVFSSFFRWYKPIYDSLEKKYPTLDWLEKDLEDAFKYVRHYYPSYKVPGIISFIGTFDAPGVMLIPGYLGVGLQQFAGKNFSVYQDPQIRQMYPEYISRRFDKEYMIAACMKAVADDIYPDTTQSGKLIEIMIEKGKQWWLLDKFLPDTHDSIKTGYSGRQVEWAEANEGNIWYSIMHNTPDLYTQDIERVQNYIGEAPFTQNMESTNSSPGNIGQWVGWRIVQKFAEKNPKLTVQQVLASPANKIFQEAKYKPK